MKGKRRLLLILLACVGVLVAAAAVALTLDYDSPALGRALLERAGRQADLDLRAEGFRLNLLRGLRLENVEVTSHAAGSSFHARADRLVLAHRLAPLLHGEIRIEEIVLERPTVELVSEAEVTVVAAGVPAAGVPAAGVPAAGVPAAGVPAAGDTPPPPDATPPASSDGSSGLALGVTRFAIVDGNVVIRTAGDAAEGNTEIHGLDLELRDIALDPAAPSVMQGLSAVGELTADEIVTPAALAKDAHGKISMEAGHLRIEGL